MCWGRDRKEGEGGFKQTGEKKPSEIQKKCFSIQREAGNPAHSEQSHSSVADRHPDDCWLGCYSRKPPSRSPALGSPPYFSLLLPLAGASGW